MSSSTNQTGSTEFIQFHVPPLEDGLYQIDVSQNVKISVKVLSSSINDGESSFSKSGQFMVQGPRFTLPPSEICSVFPPNGNSGNNDHVLASVVFNRSTLPWERSPLVGDVSDKSDPNPWLAVLLFTSAQAPAVQVMTVGDLQQPAQNSVPVKFPSLTLEPGQSAKDPVMVIDIPWGTLQGMVPTLTELGYLAHVRQPFNASGEPSAKAKAVVMGSRLPAPQGESVAFLVSVEGRYETTGSFDSQGAQANDLIRLVVLKHWHFSSLDPKASFSGLLQSLNQTPIALSQPLLASTSASEANTFLQRGYVPLPQSMLGGSQMVAWYHSPLAPQENTASLPLPAQTSDALLIYDPKTGMFDVSYAAAWELGQWLMLSQQSISLALFRWKRALYQQLKSAEISSGHPTVSLTNSDAPEVPIPAGVGSWFTNLAQLSGVPFSYLVPEENMLPNESIRFFMVDQAWMQSLFDGAFSIGRVSAGDQLRDELQKNPFLSLLQPPVSGILLRSQVVAGWPEMEVNAYGALPPANSPDQPLAQSEQLSLIRKGPLGPDTVLYLFQGIVQTLDLHLPPEALHFGVDTPTTAVTAKTVWQKTLRNLEGIEQSKVTVQVPFRNQAQGIINTSELFTGIQNQLVTQKLMKPKAPFTAAQFALEMIAGVQQVRFMRSEQKGGSA